MHQRTRVKFCGITRYEDAVAAVELGVDALGFVFYERSPRFISADAAASIIRRLPPMVAKFGLFVDADAATIAETMAIAAIDVVQFHGNETPEYCDHHSHAYVKALRVAPDTDIATQARQFVRARALLLDGYDPNQYGGTGKGFDWGQIPSQIALPIILAGGLGPNNVRQAIDQLKPYAVDVSSGIERDKGIKDFGKMQRFMQQVRDN